MSRTKTIVAVAFFLVIGGIYLFVYRDSFRKPVIHITHTHDRSAVRRQRSANAQTPATPQSPKPMFSLDAEYRLTSVKLIRLADLKARGVAPPLWELVTKSTSVPTDHFDYGVAIPGMQPTYPGIKADPLSNNVPYRLLIEAGKMKGQHDFTLTDKEYPPAEP